MNSSQSFTRRRVFGKRVASVFSISLAVALTACSSQGLPFTESGAVRFGQNNDGSVPIPSEPVYGNSDKTRTAKSDYRAPFSNGSNDADYQPASIQRKTLAPVRTASDDGGSGGHIGNSFAMQPIDAHEQTGSGTSSASGPRYAQASGYYDRGAPGYQPSYSDYKPPRRRHYEAPEPKHDYRSAKRHDDDDYLVVEGDTLYSIAKRYGLSTSELAELNGIQGSTIYVGQRLRVSGSPKYTAAHSYKRRPDHDDAGPDDGYTSYDAEERKAPTPDYPSYSGGRSYTGAHRRGYDRDDDYAAPRKRPHKRYARRYEGPDRYERDRHEDDERVNRYRKPKGSYHTYSVERGDTLYEIARRNGLSHRELADFNDIPLSATLYPGQILHLPKGRGYDWGKKRHDDEDDDYRRSREDDGYSRRVPVSQKSDDKGEQARKPERRLARLKRSDDRDERRAAEVRESEAKVQPASAPAQAAPAREGNEKEPGTILAAHRDVDAGDKGPEAAAAAPKDCESLLASPVARSATTFREPVQGLIVAKFGTRNDGSFNDGIDFSVPKGTPVKAAENGVVAYVGNELSGFGNLILVRHADGYVTAYAHNDEVMVSRCDVVKRGQVISKAGATGKVSQPQLHFELRKDSKAIDPEAYFSRS